MNEFRSRPHPAVDWDVVCAAITEDLSERLSVGEMRALMRRVGGRLARRLPLASCRTLPELEAALNAHLTECGWGRVRILERDDAMVLLHEGTGIDQALGVAARPWSPALLEGAYEQWMRSAGAGRGLEVCQRATSFGDGTIEFHLRAVSSVA